MGNVASLNPDNFVAGGLKDNFIGTVTKARFTAWDYNGKADKHSLAVRVDIKVAPEFLEDGEDPTHQAYWSAGDLGSFVPSMDGETSVDLSQGDGKDGAWDGLFALNVGSKQGLSNSSNFAFAMRKAIEAGLPKERFSTNVAEMFEGLTCRFVRLPQPKRSGLVNAPKADGKTLSNDILVITEIVSAAAAGATVAAPKSASGSPAATTTATAASGGGSANGDLDAALASIVVPAVVAAGETGLAKGKLAALALKGLPAASKGAGVKRVVSTEFLEGLAEHNVLFDGATGVLTAVATE
jgi:hypothetical protein